MHECRISRPRFARPLHSVLAVLLVVSAVGALAATPAQAADDYPPWFYVPPREPPPQPPPFEFPPGDLREPAPQPPAVCATIRANQLGVAGNAFPWEVRWRTFGVLLDCSGAGWARVELRWEQIQPSQEVWNYGGSDALVNGYADHGFQQLGLLVYSVAWATGGTGNAPVFGPPTDLDAWEAFVRTTVARYRTQIDAWEIWNEPDVSFFWNGRDGGDPRAYLPLLQRAYRAIKEIDPTAVVMNGGVTGTERGATYLSTLLDLGGGAYLDAIAIHPYLPNDALDDDGFRRAVWPLLRQVRQRAGKPLWLTEVGWSVGPGDAGAAGSESAQARNLARHLPLLFTLGEVERVFVFQFKDPNNQPDYFGITRADGTIRPAYTALATMAPRLAGLRFDRQVDLDAPGIVGLRFAAAERTVDFLWSLRGNQTVTFPSGQPAITVWRLDGSSETRPVTNGAVSLLVGADPILIERQGRAPTSDAVERCRSFPETGQVTCGAFLDFWERAGGLSVFGFPLSGELTERSSETGQHITAQYFERQRFEYHPEHAGSPYVVLLGRLGLADADRRGATANPAFQAAPERTGDAGCTFVAETGHQVCGPFRDAWQRHGIEFGDTGVSHRESVALFGLPISEEYLDPQLKLIVQYFERARFEWHPENPEPDRVLLARLGAELSPR